MASKISGDNDEPISEINIVPFVDIILVVLIIFMVTTPFIMKPSINVNLPKAGSGEDTTPSELTITIATDGRLLLNGKPSDEAKCVGSCVDSSAPSIDTCATSSRTSSRWCCGAHST